MFVRKGTVKIYHPDDTGKPAADQRYIEVKAKLNQGEAAAFWDEVGELQRAAGGGISQPHFNLLWLAHNVTGWGGPDVPEYDDALLAELDPSDPLVIKVIDTISANNAPRESPDPKSESAAETMAA